MDQKNQPELFLNKFSGMQPNKNKCSFFVVVGIANQEEKEESCNLLGFQVGTLPVKYLCIPLTST